MSEKFSRRDVLKVLGLTLGGTLLPKISWPKDESVYPLILPEEPAVPLSKPITAITLGAGSRGNVYGNYALYYPEQLKIVGVAEPIPIRNERYSRLHHIPDENRFITWEQVFERPKFADAIIITTPDRLHYGPAMAALKMGYDLLLEKPIAPSEKECLDILELTEKTGQVVAVCHVLRYSPYFIKLKELVQKKAIGELISIQHMEPIEHIHMSHSYVRGNWHNSKESTPIILAKSCHDLDILRWIVDRPSKRIQAFGDLSWFKKENTPPGATPRCMNGCAIESSCPYSAMKIYYRERGWLYVFDLPEEKEKQGDAILEYLRTTNYGRCVYDMDNDQCDHYITNIEFEGGITASFSMEAFTPWGGRRTRIMGSMGYIEGDMDRFTIYDFRTGKSETLESKAIDVENYEHAGHGGGDWRLVSNWVQAVDQHNPNLLTSTMSQSIESHIMGFRAEKSRLNGKVENINM